jgi:hypothetical protein
LDEPGAQAAIAKGAKKTQKNHRKR